MVRCKSVIRMKVDRMHAYFEALFSAYPSEQDILDAQMAQHYHPSGYGGPTILLVERMDATTYRVEFRCSASCE